jgi:hypothetical protein
VGEGEKGRKINDDCVNGSDMTAGTGEAIANMHLDQMLSQAGWNHNQSTLQS